MPKSNKYPRIDYRSPSVDKPEPKPFDFGGPRGDARYEPMDMESTEGADSFTHFHTRKLKMRHGEAGRNFGVAKKQAGEE